MNPYEIEIELPKSDGFHTREDRHLAELIQRRVQDFLDLDRTMGYPGCTVRIKTPPAATEYGIRSPQHGGVMDPTLSLSEAEGRLSRYRDMWPDAVLVQRPVYYGGWTLIEETP